jgi:alkylhydroperoxidase/carboxymuconolactone decarboxylase family protein YurZ
MPTPQEELAPIIQHFPEFWQEAGHLFTDSLYEAVHLDRKTIELILCALLAAKRWETGVRTHVAKALEVGATEEEVRGALLMSMAVAGTSAAVSGLYWAEDVIAQQ